MTPELAAWVSAFATKQQLTTNQALLTLISEGIRIQKAWDDSFNEEAILSIKDIRKYRKKTYTDSTGP